MRVAVIGAGMAGLSAVYHLSCKEHIEVCAYETSDRVGGKWICNDKYKPTMVYENLICALPKELMAFPDCAITAKGNTSSYLGHREVLEYLEDYARRKNLLQYIQFRSTVTNVTPVEKIDSKRATQWRVSVRKDPNMESFTHTYDAVVVCTGQTSVPNLPEISGISDFKGSVSHSFAYKNFEPFRDQSVVILGCGMSGKDIARDVSSVAKRVILSHDRSHDPSMGSGVEQQPGIKLVTESSVIFTNGVEAQTDAIIFCTGYQYSFPFLSSRCRLTIRNGRIHRLYRHMISIDYPTLIFIGLPKGIMPGLVYHTQSALAADHLSGQIPGASQAQMVEDEERDVGYRAVVVGQPERHAHVMQGLMWPYISGLYTLRGHICPVAPVVKELFAHVCHSQDKNLVGFRKECYLLTSQDHFAVVF